MELSLIHISEPTRQEAISYAVFCLKKKKARGDPESGLHHQLWGSAPARFSLVWLSCGGHTEVGRYLGSTRNEVTQFG